jgi:hypothetical protein
MNSNINDIFDPILKRDADFKTLLDIATTLEELEELLKFTKELLLDPEDCFLVDMHQMVRRKFFTLIASTPPETTFPTPLLISIASFIRQFDKEEIICVSSPKLVVEQRV